MNKEQVKGRIEEVKGKAKEVAGEILDDDELEAEGNVQKHVGKVQAGLGDLKEDIKDEIRENS
ncbi:MAG: CsbD family protein [Candidatus Methylumidiphilus alinenensis]|uniref:CsbD family protein n=1 Tax=Candidatus Methylumidiphilus alinenensis TaxID=2202197 RepID=A0A2W4T7I0_9GAMM|nr:MAG: CsbD family protein [Candidatus Methylumidiphilus alinenensis]